MDPNQEFLNLEKDNMKTYQTGGTGPRSSNVNLWLTERDIDAIQFICEQGIASLDQLWSTFWKTPDPNRRYAYARLHRLVSAGFLLSRQVTFARHRYYLATPLGRRTVESMKHIALPLSAPPPVEFMHAERVTDIRLILQAAGKLTSWMSDRSLLTDPRFPKERFRNYVPDALWVTPTKTRVFVEYERAFKGVSRLRGKVEAFSREMSRDDRFMDHVLWIGEPARIPELKQVVGSSTNHTVRTFDEFEMEISKEGASHGKT